MRAAGTGVPTTTKKAERPQAPPPPPARKKKAPAAKDSSPVPAKAAPKSEAPKSEAPKSEAPKSEAPKSEAPKSEAPKAAGEKGSGPKPEARAATPKPAARAATPKPALPDDRVQIPRRDTPKPASFVSADVPANDPQPPPPPAPPPPAANNGGPQPPPPAANAGGPQPPPPAAPAANAGGPQPPPPAANAGGPQPNPREAELARGKQRGEALPIYREAFHERMRERANEWFPAPKGHMASHVRGNAPGAPAPAPSEIVNHMEKRYATAARDLPPAERFALADSYSRRLVESGTPHERDLSDRLRITEANHFRRLAEDAPNATKTLIDHFNSFSGAAGGPHSKPGLVSRADLDAVLRGDARPELKAAAGFIRDTPGIFDGLDNAAKISPGNDGWIALDDARAYARTLPPPDRAAEKAELRKYSDDLLVRPGPKEAIDYAAAVSWNPISHRDGAAALKVIDELRPADHARYDLRTNIRRGDESHFLTDNEVRGLFSVRNTAAAFARDDLAAAGKFRVPYGDGEIFDPIKEGRLLYPDWADKAFDPNKRLAQPEFPNRKDPLGLLSPRGFGTSPFGDLRDPFGLGRSGGFGLGGVNDDPWAGRKNPKLTYISPKTGKTLDLADGVYVDPSFAVPFSGKLPDPKYKGEWAKLLTAYPETRPYLLKDPKTADAVVERHLTTNDPRFQKPRAEWNPDTVAAFDKERERLLAEDRRRTRIENGDPIARMRGDPATWTPEQRKVAADHDYAYRLRQMEGRIRPEWDRLDAEYKKNKWGPDSLYYGADNAMFMVDLASKDPSKVSRYDAWRGLAVAEDYRKKNPDVFAAHPDAFKTRKEGNPIYYRDLAEMKAKNIPDFAEREAALKADPNNPFAYLRKPAADLNDDEKKRLLHDYSRYGIERFERGMRARTVAGIGDDVDRLVPHFGRMLEERGLVEKGVDYLRSTIGVDGGVILDSKISADEVGKTVDGAIRAKHDLTALRNFEGTPEEFRKLYQEKARALQDRLIDTKRHMEQWKKANDAWVDGLSDVAATIAGVAAAAAAPVTFGGSLVVGFGAGALAKVGFKGLNSLESTAPYTSWRTDILTGGLAGTTGAGSTLAAGRWTANITNRASAGLAAGETLPWTTRAGAFLLPRVPIGAADGFTVGAGNALIKGEGDPLEHGLYGAAFGMALFPLGESAMAGMKGLRGTIFGRKPTPVLQGGAGAVPGPGASQGARPVVFNPTDAEIAKATAYSNELKRIAALAKTDPKRVPEELAKVDFGFKHEPGAPLKLDRDAFAQIREYEKALRKANPKMSEEEALDNATSFYLSENALRRARQRGDGVLAQPYHRDPVTGTVYTPKSLAFEGADKAVEDALHRSHARLMLEEFAHGAGGSIRPGSYVPLTNPKELDTFHRWLEGWSKNPANREMLEKAGHSPELIDAMSKTAHEADFMLLMGGLNPIERGRYPVRTALDVFQNANAREILALDPKKFAADPAAQKRLFESARIARDNQQFEAERVLKDLGIEKGEVKSILKRDDPTDFVKGLNEKLGRKNYPEVGSMPDIVRGRFNLETTEDVKRVATEMAKRFPGAEVVEPRGNYPRYHVVVTDPVTGLKHEWQIGTKYTTQFFETPSVKLPADLKLSGRPDFHDVYFDHVMLIKDAQLRAAYGLDAFDRRYTELLLETAKGMPANFQARYNAISDQLSDIIARIHREKPGLLQSLSHK